MKITSLLETDVASKYPELRLALKNYLIDMVEHEARADMDDGDEDMDLDGCLEHAWNSAVDETTNHILEIGDDDLQDAYEAAGGEDGVPSSDEYALVDGLKDEVLAAVRKKLA